jgi:release factor glutamine methyltransferase
MTEPAATPPSRRSLLRWGREQLAEAGHEKPRRVAEWLLADAVDARRVELFARPEREVPGAATARYRSMVERCADGEPLQHVLGYDEFYGLQLQVTPDVLIPRPETEEVVERLLALLSDVDTPRVLDIGTGSGCIALALKHERPEAHVHACDVSADALAVARANAERLALDIRFFEADLFADGFQRRAPSGMDAVVSNPPYIPREEAASLPAVVKDHDPAVALFAGDDPLRFYRRLAEVAPSLCASTGGLLVVECHAEHAAGVGDVFQKASVTDVHVEEDLSGRPRIAWGRVPPRDA